MQIIKHYIVRVDESGNKLLCYDETLLLRELRSITAPEAVQHLLKLEIAHLSHTVVSLGVHEPNGAQFYFTSATMEAKKKRMEEGTEFTKLQAW